ncbi:hypothetical protein C8R46DRAFT_1228824 [Mycena filopes]|nr:hypothetical protein C8R46DRAFT_1228824 [Mycena filopes]
MPRSTLRPPPVPVELKGIPSFRDGIKEWNAAWEASFPVREARACSLEFWVSANTEAAKTSPVEESDLLNHCLHRVRDLCLVQAEVQVLANTVVFQPNFCWKKLTPAARLAHMHEGLLRACMVDPMTMPLFRGKTSDITLASLEHDNGEGFLTLLKRYVPSSGTDAAATSGVCILYLHPSWTEDAIVRLRAAGHGTHVQLSILQRDDFLSTFLFNTIIAVFGTPRPAEHSYEAHGHLYSTLDWGTMPKKLSPKRMKGAPPTASPVYRVAKTVIHTEASLADAVFLLRRIGPAIDGYTRSPALIRQIQYLDIVPRGSIRDYAFFSSTGPQPVMIPCFITRIVFRLACQVAMSTGDHECIAALCELLMQAQIPTGESFWEQLKAEYGTEVVSAVQARIASAGETWTAKIKRWIGGFLNSTYGVRYRHLYDGPAPSFELTRQCIGDLREWWKRR